jgi:hypothetical protein
MRPRHKNPHNHAQKTRWGPGGRDIAQWTNVAVDAAHFVAIGLAFHCKCRPCALYPRTIRRVFTASVTMRTRVASTAAFQLAGSAWTKCAKEKPEKVRAYPLQSDVGIEHVEVRPDSSMVAGVEAFGPSVRVARQCRGRPDVAATPPVTVACGFCNTPLALPPTPFTA